MPPARMRASSPCARKCSEGFVDRARPLVIELGWKHAFLQSVVGWLRFVDRLLIA